MILPRSSRTHVPLSATLLVLALTAVGCAGTGQASYDDSSAVAPQSSSHPAAPSGEAPAPPLADSASGSDHGDVFDTDDPAIGRLSPDLRDALQAAARAAQDDGQTMFVTSGWRSREHQQRLYDEAVQKYGSEEEARRYVATPDSSAHTTGDAVDLGPIDALSWLSQHGDRYGLCQTFANEIWHYELATEPGDDCPEMLPDGSARG